jgi:hypothetical protein
LQMFELFTNANITFCNDSGAQSFENQTVATFLITTI